MIKKISNPTVWWIMFLQHPLAAWALFDWKVALAFMVNGAWASESFFAVAQAERDEEYQIKYDHDAVCGQSVYTYNFNALWLSYGTAVWYKQYSKTWDVFSWGWRAFLAYYLYFSAAGVGVSLYIDPPRFNEKTMKKWTTLLNGKMMSHTGHAWGLISGFSLIALLKYWKWL